MKKDKSKKFDFLMFLVFIAFIFIMAYKNANNEVKLQQCLRAANSFKICHEKFGK